MTEWHLMVHRFYDTEEQAKADTTFSQAVDREGVDFSVNMLQHHNLVPLEKARIEMFAPVWVAEFPFEDYPNAPDHAYIRRARISAWFGQIGELPLEAA